MLKSETYYRRQELLQNNQIPNRSEIINRHGDNLSNVIYQSMSTQLQIDLGLIPTMAGAGLDLWISPSDLLISIVKLKPPLTTKYIKALTHEEIINIGLEVEKKIENAFRIEKEKALFNLAKSLKKEYEKEIMFCRAEVKREAQAEFEAAIKILTEKYIDSLTNEIENLKLKIEMEEKIKIENMCTQVRDEMHKTYAGIIEQNNNELSEKFKSQLQIQANELKDKYDIIMKQKDQVFKKDLEKVCKEKLECLRFLRHELECKNMVNIIYILCIERQKYLKEKMDMDGDYQIKIQEMKNKVLEQTQKINDLEIESDIRTKNLEAWKETVNEIIKQFQKYINITLKAIPSQAEFLLNFNKLFKMAVKEISCKSNVTFLPSMLGNENVSLVPEIITGEKHQEHYFKENIMKYKLTAPDSENSLTDSNKTLGSDEILPSFILNRHLYVREDFQYKNNKSSDNKQYDLWKDCSDSNINDFNLMQKINTTQLNNKIHTDDELHELQCNIAKNASASELNIQIYDISMESKCKDEDKKYDHYKDPKRKDSIIKRKTEEIQDNVDKVIPGFTRDSSQVSKLVFATNSLEIHKKSFSQKTQFTEDDKNNTLEESAYDSGARKISFMSSSEALNMGDNKMKSSRIVSISSILNKDSVKPKSLSKVNIFKSYENSERSILINTSKIKTSRVQNIDLFKNNQIEKNASNSEIKDLFTVDFNNILNFKDIEDESITDVNINARECKCLISDNIEKEIPMSIITTQEKVVNTCNNNEQLQDETKYASQSLDNILTILKQNDSYLKLFTSTGVHY